MARKIELKTSANSNDVGSGVLMNSVNRWRTLPIAISTSDSLLDTRSAGLALVDERFAPGQQLSFDSARQFGTLVVIARYYQFSAKIGLLPLAIISCLLSVSAGQR